ncbi:dynamin family protein [Bacillus sp. JJ1474]|uniref:dynamin family protein n=1 Tax=Bacillus sp. JJ1474 TaxID=3122955 RepID=UPI002FFECB6E
MDIWDQVEDKEELNIFAQAEQLETVVHKIEEQNEYLRDKDKAISIIFEILKEEEKNREIRASLKSFERLINIDLSRFSNSISVAEDMDAYQKIIKLKNKIFEIQNIRILSGKNIIGIGGGFNAGKSKFINSLVDYSLLPEDQTPATSIPTYIVKGERKISAFTFVNDEVEIDEDAMHAITHAFYNKYNLGFAQILKNIVAQLPAFEWENSVILDTPGYTKSDTNKAEGNKDEEIARHHLKTADLLIWLVDIENGTVKNEDLHFISSLGISKPILFIFNKADQKPESHVKEIVLAARKALSEKGIPFYAVTAYSSLEKKEYTGNYIMKFLERANKPVKDDSELAKELEGSLKVYQEGLRQSSVELLKQKEEVTQLICEAQQIEQIYELAVLYSSINHEVIKHNQLSKDFMKMKKKFLSTFDAIVGV